MAQHDSTLRNGDVDRLLFLHHDCSTLNGKYTNGSKLSGGCIFATKLSES